MAAPRPCGRLRGEGESSFLHPAGRWASRSPVGPVRGTDTGERRAGRRGAAPTTLTLAGDPLPALPCLRPARTQPRRGPVTFRARVPPLPPSRSGRCRGRRKGAGRPAPQRRAPPGRGEAADSPPTPRLTFRASPSSRKSAVSLKTATGGARGTAVKMEAAMAARRGPLRSAPLRSAPLRAARGAWRRRSPSPAGRRRRTPPPISGQPAAPPPPPASGGPAAPRAERAQPITAGPPAGGGRGAR